MKRVSLVKRLLSIAMALTLAFSMLAACSTGGGTSGGNSNTAGNNSNSTGSGNDTSGSQTTGGNGSASSPSDAQGGNGTSAGSKVPAALNSMSDVLEEQSRLYDFHEEAINNCDDIFLSLELVTTSMGLLNLATSYLWINTADAVGVYGDIDSTGGRITRTADSMVFEVDHTLGENESHGASGEGDHMTTNGKIDFRTGVAWYESFDERVENDKNLYRYDYLVKPGKIIELAQHSYESEWFETGNNTFSFTIMDADEFHFVTAKANIGMSLKLLDFDPSKDTAAMKTIFENAGFEIVYYGVVSDGSVTLQ